MKIQYLAAAVIAFACAGAASAETSAPAAVAKAAHYSVASTPIADLGADPAARAAVEKQFPGLFQHSSYEMIKGMSLKAVAPYSQGAITDDKLAALQKDLDALP